jgi:universal stress protein E
MKNVTKILAVLDPTASEQPAAKKACHLAMSSGAKLELFVCDYDQYLSGERFFDSEGLKRARDHIIERHRQRLLKVADDLRHEIPGAEKLEISVDARWDNPRDDAILRKLNDSKADLMVKDTHFHNVLKRSIFTNTDWELIRGCDSRLLLVKPEPWKTKPVIVAAVDPTHQNDEPAALDKLLLDTASEIAKDTGGSLHVFHACDAASAYAVSADSIAFPVSVPVREIAEGMRKHHREAMDALLTSWKTDVEYESHFIEGETRESLLSLIEQVQADIVVMGAVARNALQRVFLGSTAERVLDHLPCDLLILKAR